MENQVIKVLKHKLYGISHTEVYKHGFHWPENGTCLWENFDEARKDMYRTANSMLTKDLYVLGVGESGLCIRNKDTDENVVLMTIFEIQEIIKDKGM